MRCVALSCSAAHRCERTVIIVHTYAALGWDGMGWAVLCIAMRCDVTLCFSCIVHEYSYVKKMAEDEDDDAAQTSSATYRELMHINSYWSLIGSSLPLLTSVLGKNASRVFTEHAS